jgi:CRP-like cAMP-binding protein
MTVGTYDEGSANAASFVGRAAQRFPNLSSAQIARLEGRGTHVRMSKGEILMEPGDRNRPMLVVLSGSIEVLQSGLKGEVSVAVHTPGSFTGEMSTLSSMGSVVRMRVREDGEGFESFGCNPAATAIFDAQHLSVRLSRHRRGSIRPDALREISRQGRRYTSGFVPRRRGT